MREVVFPSPRSPGLSSTIASIKGIYSFLSFSRYLLSAYYVPGTVPGLCPGAHHRLVEEALAGKVGGQGGSGGAEEWR